MRSWATVAAVCLLLAGSPAGAASLLVCAASSLTQAFRDIGRAFETAHPGASVEFNFAASDVLVAQIARGAPADVFASADDAAMTRGEKGEAFAHGTRRDFAANRLVVVVPASRSSLPALAALGGPRYKRIAIGSPLTVPAGRYAKDALQRAELWTTLEPRLVFAQNVRQALDYVAREEVDAAFVYATDAAIMPERVKVALEVPTATPIRYSIAVVRDSGQPKLATAFIDFVQGAAGQEALGRHGFRAP